MISPKNEVIHTFPPSTATTEFNKIDCIVFYVSFLNFVFFHNKKGALFP